MTNLIKFNSDDYQNYISKVTDLVKQINQCNQRIYGLHQDYINESYLAYGEHMKALMNNPMDYVNLNSKYLNESSSRYQRLFSKRYDLFSELSSKLAENNTIMFLFPVQIQEAIQQFRDSGKINTLNPKAWAKFTQMLTNR